MSWNMWQSCKNLLVIFKKLGRTKEVIMAHKICKMRNKYFPSSYPVGQDRKSLSNIFLVALPIISYVHHSYSVCSSLATEPKSHIHRLSSVKGPFIGFWSEFFWKGPDTGFWSVYFSKGLIRGFWSIFSWMRLNTGFCFWHYIYKGI